MYIRNKKLFRKVEELEPLFKKVDTTLTNHLFKIPGEEFKKMEFNDGILTKEYEISNYGRVYHLEKKIFLKQHKHYGYNKASIHINGSSKSYGVHRLVAMNFCEEGREDQTFVNHINSIRDDNYYENLEWCNHDENMRHMVEQGNSCKGSKNITSKFNEEQVHIICQLLEKGYNYREICNELGIEYDNKTGLRIGCIRKGETWTHISKYYNLPEKFIHDIREDETIHEICKLMEAGLSSKEVAVQLFDADPTNREEMKKYYRFFYKLKSRLRYKRIVEQYNVPYPEKKK